jgi:hypothetical protein
MFPPRGTMAYGLSGIAYPLLICCHSLTAAIVTEVCQVDNRYESSVECPSASNEEQSRAKGHTSVVQRTARRVQESLFRIDGAVS